MYKELIVGSIAILGLLYFYLTKNYDYWKKKRVVFIKPTFPFGILHDQFFGKADLGNSIQKWYTIYKQRGLKFVGGFTMQQPTLIILDLDLCKQILTKDFNHFVTRDYAPKNHEHLTTNLFASEGQEWRDMRTKLTPTFTTGKMKTMFSLMEKCVNQLQDHIDNVVLEKGEFMVKDLTARFTSDIIATCVFGLEVNSMDNDNKFFQIGELIFVPKRTNFLKILMFRNFPKISKLINLNFFNPKIFSFFTKIMKDTVEYRAKNKITRNDFIDLLVKVKENKSLEDDERISKEPKEEDKQGTSQQEKDCLTLEDMAAQAFGFFAAGYETVGSTTSFCLYELAKNPHVQETLRREVDEVLGKYGGKITYQAIQEMSYMDQVMYETLRLYAALPMLTRVCTEKYNIPGTDLVIDKGVRVMIPTYAIHRDPDIYPDPYKFDPDRFSEENSKNRHQYAFLPFGEGPRICIGIRFGKIQVKLGLAAILSKYELSPAVDTPSHLEISPMISITTVKSAYHVRITRRSDL